MKLREVMVKAGKKMLTEFKKTSTGFSFVLVTGMMLSVGACGPSKPPLRSDGHLSGATAVSVVPEASMDIPETVQQVPALPKPTIQPKLETYTVVVTEAPAKELLFALARDAKLNLDVYDNIEGLITINAIDQTLPQILDRIAKQSNIRYEINGKNLSVSEDTPYLHTYAVEYVNMSRETKGQIDLSTQISSTGSGSVGTQGGGSQGNNDSSLSVKNGSDNQFWKTLFLNIQSIINDDSKGGVADLVSRNVIVNREAGVINVRASSKQHLEVQSFIDTVVKNAQRQVLIEATVVEVTLSNDFQAGVDWSRLASGAVSATTGFADGSNGASLFQQVTSSGLSNAPVFTANYNNTDGDVTATVRMLEEFGDIKVLSSPKIMALNNQAAVLKVVDNRVYFTADVNITNANNVNSLPLITTETEIHTVPVGFVMGVTPYVSENNQVILNVRPTISRILRFVKDPNPGFATASTENLIPEIQVREMESILRLNNGQMGIIGGLMQDEVNKDTDAVPLLSRLPFVGNAFKYRNDQTKKSELVIFIRAIVIENPSVDADLYHLRTFLPTSQRP